MLEQNRIITKTNLVVYNAAACYNGNISTQKWQASGESFNRGYRFTYDPLNRLSEAVYGENDFSDNINDYNEKVVEYSANGMMKRFQRRGLKSDGEYGKVDNLHITLDGNRIQYVYSPDGQKLRATWQTAVANIVVPLNTTASMTNSQISSTTRTDYIGNVIYTGTASSYATGVSLSKYLFEGGYAMVTPSTQPVFHFYTQDHLGNNRAVMGQGGTVEQITHYYPFGGFFADAGTGSSLQPYKYNGKELDRMHGLDLYDYGARQYDPVVPMFTQQDPMAEKYYHLSPYVYCGNNPVNAVDIDGRSILKIGGKALYRICKAVAKSGFSALYKAETYYSAFNDIEGDIKTITDENTTTTEKVEATASLASELAPLSIKDIRSVSNAAKEALSKGQKILGREGKVIV